MDDLIGIELLGDPEDAAIVGGSTAIETWVGSPSLVRQVQVIDWPATSLDGPKTTGASSV